MQPSLLYTLMCAVVAYDIFLIILRYVYPITVEKHIQPKDRQQRMQVKSERKESLQILKLCKKYEGSPVATTPTEQKEDSKEKKSKTNSRHLSELSTQSTYKKHTPPLDKQRTSQFELGDIEFRKHKSKKIKQHNNHAKYDSHMYFDEKTFFYSLTQLEMETCFEQQTETLSKSLVFAEGQEQLDVYLLLDVGKYHRNKDKFNLHLFKSISNLMDIENKILNWSIITSHGAIMQFPSTEILINSLPNLRFDRHRTELALQQLIKLIKNKKLLQICVVIGFNKIYSKHFSSQQVIYDNLLLIQIPKIKFGTNYTQNLNFNFNELLQQFESSQLNNQSIWYILDNRLCQEQYNLIHAQNPLCLEYMEQEGFLFQFQELKSLNLDQEIKIYNYVEQHINISTMPWLKFNDFQIHRIIINNKEYNLLLKNFYNLENVLDRCKYHLIAKNIMDQFNIKIKQHLDTHQQQCQLEFGEIQLLYIQKLCKLYIIFIAQFGIMFQLVDSQQYSRYNNNYGYLMNSFSQQNILAQAFTYYTYIKSNQQYMITNIQGFGQYLFDPNINTIIGNLNQYDMGMEAINYYMKQFKNNQCLDLSKELLRLIV